MSARHEYDPSNEFRRIGRCPRCGGVIQRGDLIHDGLLRTRSASRGGPYYLLSCAHCGERIIVERSSPTSTYRIRREQDLPPTSPLRRILTEFLGGSSRPQRNIAPSPERNPERSTDRSPEPKTKRDTKQAEHSDAPKPKFTTDRPTPEPSPRTWSAAQRHALEILGLTESATLPSIKKAYRAVARSLHPDAHPRATEDQRTEWSRRFAAATDAYRLLTSRKPTT